MNTPGSPAVSIKCQSVRWRATVVKFLGSGRRWCSVRILMLLGTVWLGECSLPLLVWILVTFHDDFCLFVGGGGC